MSITALLIGMFVVLNIAAFAVYGADKKKAEKHEWRTPESTLIGIALFAPWGSIAGMQLFRHKTQKPKFRLIYVFAVLHALIAVFLILS